MKNENEKYENTAKSNPVSNSKPKQYKTSATGF
jgi:hypothetical protein